MRIPLSLFVLLTVVATSLVSDPPDALGQAPPPRPAARPVAPVLDLVRQSLDSSYRYTPGAAREALALARQAVAVDSTYAPAWVQLGWSYGIARDFEPDSLSAYKYRWLAAAERAFALDSTDGGAMVIQAMERTWRNDLSPATEALARTGVARAPGVMNDGGLAWVLVTLGKRDEVATVLRRMTARDSLVPVAWITAAYRLANVDRYREAASAMERALALRPSEQSGRSLANLRRWARLESGDCAGALADGRAASNPMLIIESLRCLGRRAEADSVIDSRLALTTVSPENRAIYLAWRDRPDSAFAVLDRTFPPGLGFTLADAAFDPYRRHPGYLALARRLGLSP